MKKVISVPILDANIRSTYEHISCAVISKSYKPNSPVYRDITLVPTGCQKRRKPFFHKGKVQFPMALKHFILWMLVPWMIKPWKTSKNISVIQLVMVKTNQFLNRLVSPHFYHPGRYFYSMWWTPVPKLSQLWPHQCSGIKWRIFIIFRNKEIATCIKVNTKINI